MTSTQAPKAEYQKSRTSEPGQLEMLQALELSAQDHKIIHQHCQQQGIEFMSTPFDSESLDFLVQEINVKRLKLSSGDLTNAPLLLQAAQSGVPLILSTGMATLAEIEQALGVVAFGLLGWHKDKQPSANAFVQAYADPKARKILAQKVTILHCTTQYPAPPEAVDLRAMETIKQAFQCPTGYSDHTLGLAIALAAAARGACVIEKHYTLDKTLPGPDHAASLEPDELAALVMMIGQVGQALGNFVKRPHSEELANRVPARKSLVAACDIAKGAKLTAENLTVKRPGNGRDPAHYWELLDTLATQAYKADDLIA